MTPATHFAIIKTRLCPSSIALPPDLFSSNNPLILPMPAISHCAGNRLSTSVMLESGIEEKRILILMRLGKWVERTRKCNPFYGIQMQDHYNLWPKPVAEIERNNKAVPEQNPGYN